MLKKMVLIFILILILIGCHTSDDVIDNTQQTEANLEIELESNVSLDYLNFEEAVFEFATHIVVAQYVESQPFGDFHTEFEFVVIDEILGETTERIFVFLYHTKAHVHGHENEVFYLSGDLSFEPGIDYLLPLINTNSIDSIINREGDEFIFISQIMIDLDDPSNSNIYSENLDDHIEGIDLDEHTEIEEIISFVEEIAEAIEAEDRFEHIIIESSDMEEIINGSPYVWIVEINEVWRLADEVGPRATRRNDLYYVTIIDALKGGKNVTLKGGTIEAPIVAMAFLPDVVFLGERHVVAVQPLAEDDRGAFLFTSRYGLFSLDQLEEIEAIIAEQQNMYD